MNRVSGWALLLLMLQCGVACAKPPVNRWDAVEGLKPGDEINVLSGNEAGPELCEVLAADENGLTCLAENSDVRLVFPQNAVRDVWVFEQQRDRHIGMWIGVGLGFVLGGVMCVGGGPGAFFVCGALGAGFFGAMMTEPMPWQWGYPGPIRPSPLPRWHRRLVYRAPVGLATPRTMGP